MEGRMALSEKQKAISEPGSLRGEPIDPSNDMSGNSAAPSAQESAPWHRHSRRIVLQSIRDSMRQMKEPGLTANDLEILTGLPGSTVRMCLTQLRESSLIMDSGRIRKTRNGRQAMIWVPT